MQPFTAKDIAERIQRRGEPLQAAVDRLKNWTREGLIKPSGEKNPGKGRSRQYSPRAMFDATLLQWLVGTGMSAVNAANVLKGVTTHVTPSIFAGGCKGLVCMIAWPAGASKVLFWAGTKRDIEATIEVEGPWPIHTVINLELIYQRAFPEGK